MSRYRVRYVRADRDSIRYAMRRAGYEGRGAVRDLAADAGVRQQTLSNVLGGYSRRPCSCVLLALADALGVDPRDLMETEYEEVRGDGD